MLGLCCCFGVEEFNGCPLRRRLLVMATAPAIGVEVNGIFGGNGDVSLPLESEKERKYKYMALKYSWLKT